MFHKYNLQCHLLSQASKERLFSTSTIVVLKAQCKVRTEPKSGIPESKPEPYNANLEAPIFSVHRAALEISVAKNGKR